MFDSTFNPHTKPLYVFVRSPQKARRRLGIFFAILVAGIVITILLNLSKSSRDAAFVVGFLTAITALPLTIITGIGVLAIRTETLELYDDGFLMKNAQGETTAAYPWTDVTRYTEVQQNNGGYHAGGLVGILIVEGIRRMSDQSASNITAVKLTTTNRKTFQFGGNYERFGELAHVLPGVVAKGWEKGFIAQIKRGSSVEFDVFEPKKGLRLGKRKFKLALTPNGVTFDDNTIPWNAITNIRYVDKQVNITHRASGTEQIFSYEPTELKSNQIGDVVKAFASNVPKVDTSQKDMLNRLTQGRPL
jgi:hypothetical protein